jgi:hypothetical protein
MNSSDLNRDIGDANMERPTRAQSSEPRVAARVTKTPRKVAPVDPLGNLARYMPPFTEDCRAEIAETAYLKAERRGFAPGHELEDWLAAENEVEQRLAGEGRAF